MDNDTITITMGDGTYNGLTTVPSGGYTLDVPSTKEFVEDLLDEYVMNEVVIDYRVQAHELLKMKEDNPNFADDIKENIAKDMARNISKKISYTKRYDLDADRHNFRGRAWVFTKEELIEFIKKVRQDV